MKGLVLALTLTALLGPAACGGDESTGTGSEESQVRDVIALGNGKDPDVCDRLTDYWMRNVVGGDRADCEQQVRQSPKDAVEIEDISIEGEQATVTAQIEGDPGRLILAKEDGKWKLDDVQRGE